MKHLNLKLIGIIVLLSTTIPSFSQNNWTINGNGNTDPINNFLGTTNNFGLSIRTFDTERVYINPNRTQTILGYTFNANGYMGLGENSVAPAHPNGVWNDFGPFSILHLNGSGTEVRPSGFRPWMQTGITLTDNHDLSYFGLRKVS